MRGGEGRGEVVGDSVAWAYYMFMPANERPKPAPVFILKIDCFSSTSSSSSAVVFKSILEIVVGLFVL